MGVMTTGTIPKAMWPGINSWFGRQYAEHTPEWRELFDLDTSNKGWEEVVEVTGFGLAPVKTQGEAVSYDAETQNITPRFTHVVYGLGFIVTQEEVEDNLYPIVGKRRSRALAFSMRQTKENVCANVYNRAFNSSYTMTGGDGLELCSTAHVTSNGTQSNELSTAADLSEASLEDLLILIHKAKNSKGLRISLKEQCLIVPPDLYFDAHRIYDSTLQNDTANNATNVVKGMLPKGIKVNHYLTDTDAWFVRTNCPESMIFFQRRKLRFGPDSDFDTDNQKYKATERYSMGWGDFRGVYGSPGA